MLALAVASQANADVINFNELVPRDTVVLGTIVCADQTGFRFLSEHFHMLGSPELPGFTDNGTRHIGYESGRGLPIQMERMGGGTFALRALDVAEFYAPPQPDRPNAQTVSITGYQAGGAVVTFTTPLDGIFDGPGGAADFQHIVLPNTFVNLTRVVFTGLRDGTLDGGLSLDNIDYTAGAPEVLAPCVATPIPADPPTVAIVSPAPGPVAYNVLVEATASSYLGIGSVQFRLDGVALGPADTTAPYSILWDSTLALQGAHTLSAVARDASGTETSTSIVVNVEHPVATPHFLALDGVDDVLQVADAADLSFGNGSTDRPLTIETWIRPEAMGRHQLFGKWGETSNQEYRLRIVSGYLLLALRDQSSGAEVYAVTQGNFAGLAGAWHHLAVTYDGRGGGTAANGITMYVDGVSVALDRSNSASYVAMEDLAAPFEMGREGPNWNQYLGGLDEMRIWNVVRTGPQIVAGMSAELAGTETGLVGYWRFNEGRGVTATDDGPGSHTAVLQFGPSWQVGGPLVADTTAPAIGAIATSGLTTSSVTVSFTTSEAASAAVAYTSTACPCPSVPSASTGTAHTVTLSGLTPDTLYQYQITATDAAGNVGSSATLSFRTLVPPPDTTVPVVAFTAPAAGPVLGTVALTVAATDNVGVASVQFRVDGVNLGAADTTAPYTVSWNTTTATEGAHTLTAVARDFAGNTATATVAVTVQNTLTPHYVALDGVDDYLETPDAADLSFGNGTTDRPLTLEAWLRPDAMGRHQVVGKWGDGRQEYRLRVISGYLQVALYDQSAQAEVSVLTQQSFGSLAGSWHHVAVTYDGRGGAAAANGITLYVDGVAVALARSTNAAYVAMEDLGAPLTVGRESQQWNQYVGGVEDLRIWNVARTALQVTGNMNVTLAGTEAGLVGYWRFDEGVGVAANDDGPGTHTLTLLLGPSWQAGGPLVADTTAPTISGIATSGLTTSSVTVTFTTSEAASAAVAYTSTACPCPSVPSASTGTAHTVTLTGLTPDTLYQYMVSATDAAGNVGNSATLSFRTLVPPPDTTVPVVAFTAPAAGPVLGTVALTVAATDNVGVASVQFRVDGVNLGAADTTAPYTVSWNTTTATEGAHTLTAVARDFAGNTATATVAVTVQNTLTPHYVALDGVDDYLETPDAADLSFGNGTTDRPLTLEAWLRPDAMGRHQVVGKWGEGANQEYRVRVISGYLQVALRDQSAQAEASVLSQSSFASLTGGWHHLAVTYDGRGGATAANGITVYVDGVAIALERSNNAAYVAMEDLGAPLVVGRESLQWNQYVGGLDELRIWNVARTALQITGSMNATLAGTEAGLVGYWRFNEGVGVAANDDGPGAHTATLLLGTTWPAGGPLAPQ